MGKIVLAGGSGFLGRALAGHFAGAGHEVLIVTRSRGPARPPIREVAWDGRTSGDWASELEGATALVNLAGRSVDCRYNERNRRLILESRVDSTRVLGEAIAGCAKPPPVWLNASTATIYKHNFGPPWGESGEIGATPEAKDDFSVHVAREWGKALCEAPTPSTRRVALRAAMVLGLAKNSVFPVLRRLSRLGLGGAMGGGRQFVSWIHEADFCRAVDWLITETCIDGAVNICAPNPVPNAEMMRTFREVCGVPVGLPAPAWMLEMGAFFMRAETELILKSRCVAPRRLLRSGFVFKYPRIREALLDLQKSSAG
jgi:uncharacterized protein (TIGR01777 family)